MSSQRFAPEFNDEAVRRVVGRGYSVKDVAERAGVSAHSLYKWVKGAKHVAAQSTYRTFPDEFQAELAASPKNKRSADDEYQSEYHVRQEP